MGVHLIDNFSIVHAASGVFLYFWGFSLLNTTLIHILFEIMENTKSIMRLTNETGWWPGGKPEADNLTNMVGDTIVCILGWIMAYIIDKKYEKDSQKRGMLI